MASPGVGEITATNGIVDQPNIRDYPVARIHEAHTRLTFT
jgi:hypothetical protein